MADDNTPNGESGAADGAQHANAKRSLTDQIRNEAIVQSANLFLVARRILTTSLGAIALSIEETNEFIERLVERGEVAEHELSAMVDEISEQIADRGKSLMRRRLELPDVAADDVRLEAISKQPSANAAATEPAAMTSAERSSGLLGDRVESILGRLNVPTRNDIESITSKIEVLSGKVLLLKNKSTRTMYTEASPATEAPEETEIAG